MIAERGVWARRRYRGFEQPARQVPQELVLPRKPPRETDFAAERPKGDGFRLVSVSLARFRDIPPGKLPRGAPRVTVFAARCPKGDGFRPIPVSLACSRGIPTGQLPRKPPRETDSAAERPKGDGFRPISVSLACSRGSRRSAGAARPPSTQKTRLERRAFTTKLCSRTRAYRLSASTGQEEMQAPHSMHSSSLTSA